MIYDKIYILVDRRKETDTFCSKIAGYIGYKATSLNTEH